MFFKRTIKPHKPVTEVDTADEALAVSMGEKAAIDMEYMMELSGKSEEELFSDLKGVIFLNPLYEYGNSYEPKYLMADEYLSGNNAVKGKGYGTQAERLALRFVFDVLGMTTVLADAIRENTRSQHVLKKGGFRFVGEDGIFRYYCIDR
jgi:N12 class adenine-specific DNA methylase